MKGVLTMQPETNMIENLSAAEQEAMSLTRAAVYLDQARANGRDSVRLVEALNNNLELWVFIRAMAESKNSILPEPLRGNLLKLSSFVAQTTFSQGANITDSSIDCLININLQLSEGLLEGQKKTVTALAS
jgi:flagellar biosynthesis regulator FlaF